MYFYMASKEYVCYLYSLYNYQDNNIELLTLIKSKLDNTKSFIINETSESGIFLIQSVKEKAMDILPKKMDKNEKDLSNPEVLDLQENICLYDDVYILLDLNNINILEWSLWIIEVLNIWWKESILNVQNIFREISWCDIVIKPICYKDKEKYISDNNRRITKFSFKVAARNAEKPIVWISDEDWLMPLFDVKDKLWGEEMEVMYVNENWLNKKEISKMIKNNQSIEFQEITIDEVGKKVDQKISEIRYKDVVKLSVESRKINSNVEEELLFSYKWVLKSLKEEYLAS